MTKRTALLAAIVAALLAFAEPRDAQADEEKRPPQDYGVPSEETTTGDVVAWPVRIILSPLWFVTEFVLRRPLGALVRAAEAGRWIESVEDFFTFSRHEAPSGEVSVLPSALVDVGLKPSVGFNGSWKHLGIKGNRVGVHFGTWGSDLIAVHASDTYDLSMAESVFVEGSVTRRVDNPFSGIGPRTRQDVRDRYAATVADVDIGNSRNFWGASLARTRLGLRTLRFGDGGCCNEPNLADEVAAGRISAPGYGRGYRAMFQRVELELDSRLPRPATAGGLRIEGHEEGVFTVDPVAGEPRRSWVKYGGSVGGSLDLTGQRRVVSLTLAAELSDPLVGGIPFTDLVSLGGDSLMPGFLRGRLVDRSAAVAHLEYAWPIWVFLDGFAHAAVGNVFGEHFSGFDVKAARLSTGVGFRSNGNPKTGFELLFALGSEPFDDRFKIDSFRLLIGSHHGF